MTALTWTSERPTVEGFYWWRHDDWPAEVVSIEVTPDNEVWQYDTASSASPCGNLRGEWAGPLEAPPASPLRTDHFVLQARLMRLAESLGGTYEEAACPSGWVARVRRDGDFIALVVGRHPESMLALEAALLVLAKETP